MKIKWFERFFLLLVFCAGFQLHAQQSDADRKAFEETKAKADKGDVVSQWQIGTYYKDIKNFAEAVGWFQKAADKGYAPAQVNLGVLYAKGNGVKKDVAEAIKWYRKAADQDCPPAQYALGTRYYKGDGVEKSSSEAFKWLKKAAKEIPVAQFMVGKMYALGEGVQQDFVEAAIWYRKAAEQNNAEAQYTLGICYAKGEGVEKNIYEATKWFRNAADQNLALAQFCLACHYSTGEGVEKNAVEAVKWWRKAAEQNDAPAQYQLGRRYYFGDGVLVDYAEAVKWNALAAAQGDEDAVKMWNYVLKEKVPADQIAEGQRRAAAFKPGNAAQKSSIVPNSPAAEPQTTATGTGFFITDDGFLVTCAHVVQNASQVRLVTSTGTVSAKVVRVDSATDIALLKARGQFKPLLVAASRGVKLGGTVATVGFPNIGLQGFAPKLAKGEIASLSGAGDDARYFQISVPVQPGNSGGALVDERGNVVGVVSAKLSAKAALAASGALPENVNYAVKSSFLLSFLESVPEVSAKLKEPNTKAAAFEDVVKSAQDAAVLVLVY